MTALRCHLPRGIKLVPAREATTTTAIELPAEPKAPWFARALGALRKPRAAPPDTDPGQHLPRNWLGLSGELSRCLIVPSVAAVPRLLIDTRNKACRLLDAFPRPLILPSEEPLLSDAKRILARAPRRGRIAISQAEATLLYRAIQLVRATFAAPGCSGPVERSAQQCQGLSALMAWVREAVDPAQRRQREAAARACRASSVEPAPHPSILQFEEPAPHPHLSAIELPPASILRALWPERSLWLRLRTTTGQIRNVADFRSALQAFDGITLEPGLWHGGLPEVFDAAALHGLDLGNVMTPIDWPALWASVARQPGLRWIEPPHGQTPLDVPPGWEWDDVNRRCHSPAGLAAIAIEAAEAATAAAAAAAEAEEARARGAALNQAAPRGDIQVISDFVDATDKLIERLHDSGKHRQHTGRHKTILKALQHCLRSGHAPALAEAAALIRQAPGHCEDANLMRLDNLDAWLKAGRLGSLNQAAELLLRQGMQTRAAQHAVVANPLYVESQELASGLAWLVDQCLDDLLPKRAHATSQPYYGQAAGTSPLMSAPRRQWRTRMDSQVQARDAVLRQELDEGLPTLRELLTQESGLGRRIRDFVERQPACAKRAQKIEAEFQKAHAAAVDADPDNPHAGWDVYLAKEAALIDTAMDTLHPALDPLLARIRKGLSKP
ncbi:hypothetical protein [Roseateles aquatilis]|uniref:hypothetical protein n=1 Tax=Roseateles aquatilis TaxID=431061 RepID=UPI001130AC03|nr:hypothetical protein [Roseateles aquatilis]